jgi:hypothetical protein
MKFYISNYWRIRDFKLTAIDFDYYYVRFYENGVLNKKNRADHHYDNYKKFYLNGKYYGNQDDFTKQSWRHFIKLQAFL